MQHLPFIQSAPLPQWLPTGQAARVLGCSSDTLKRYADRDEFLIDGQHWRRGPHANSPRVWNIPACEEALHWRGRGYGGAPRSQRRSRSDPACSQVDHPARSASNGRGSGLPSISAMAERDHREDPAASQGSGDGLLIPAQPSGGA